MITIDEFKKGEITIGKILSVETIDSLNSLSISLKHRHVL